MAARRAPVAAFTGAHARGMPMRVDQQPAYLLHARAYRETSLLLEAYTRDHGRVGLVARGVRRERSRWPRGLLQPLQPLLLDWVARGELGSLTGAEAASAPLQLAGARLPAAMYLNELVLRLSARADAQPRAFAHYATCLARLQGEADPGWSLRRFERDFLGELGYGLALVHAGDGQPLQAALDYGYDPETGALPWHEHLRLPRVSGAALLALERDEQPDAAALAQLRVLMRGVIRHLLGGDLQSWAHARALQPRSG